VLEPSIAKFNFQNRPLRLPERTSSCSLVLKFHAQVEIGTIVKTAASKPVFSFLYQSISLFFSNGSLLCLHRQKFVSQKKGVVTEGSTADVLPLQQVISFKIFSRSS
jgi:hypothetical protein